MTQPEVLRLADALEFAASQIDAEDDVSHVARWFVEDAAAELRRLSAENEAYGVHLSERMKDLAKVEAQRDALLEALKKIAAIGNKMWGTDWEEIDEARGIARAAIKAVEENT